MTVDRLSQPAQPRTMSVADTLLDGLFTGMIGALAVALWFLILDVAAGRPLYTPALLGWVLLNGGGAVPATIAPAAVPIAAYTAVHFVAFAVVGVLVANLMNLFERFPIMFFVLLVLFVCLQLGFFAFDAVLGAQLTGRLRPWAVVAGNLLAAGSMATYQWKRHPGVLTNIEKLWEADVDR